MLEEQPSENNQVFKQDGRTSGQGAVVTGPLEEVVAEVVTTPTADEVLMKVLVLVMAMYEVVMVVATVVVPPVT